MSRLSRLKTATHGGVGLWAHDEIVKLRKQRDELLAFAEWVLSLKTGGMVEGKARAAVASVKGGAA
jgi:hypothetical protein